MYQKMWFVETAGSQQTSSLIMLWAKRVCTYVVGGRVEMNDTCLFTFHLKNLYLIYTPSSLRHRPRRNRCVVSCKMRLAFISIVNLHVTPADLFSRKMRLDFFLTINLHVTFVKLRRNRCIFQWKINHWHWKSCVERHKQKEGTKKSTKQKLEWKEPPDYLGPETQSWESFGMSQAERPSVS